MQTKVTLTIVLIIIMNGLYSQIIHIPDDQPNIQAGIDISNDGDTVLVSDGTYYENINFNGKAITVASHFLIDHDTSHIDNTIIDGSWPQNPQEASVVSFDSGEDTTSIICGFTLTGGTGRYIPGWGWAGGGIFCYPAGAKIINNKIENNILNSSLLGFGGGMMCEGDWVVIKNNKIQNNEIHCELEGSGGGIDIYGNAIICNNIITQNKIFSSGATQYTSNGGGIECAPSPGSAETIEINIKNNWISNNEVHSIAAFEDGGAGGGLIVFGPCEGSIKGNTLSYNVVSGTEKCAGAGVLIINTSNDLSLENNIISNNGFDQGICRGGGIMLNDASPMILNNIVYENNASVGGGIYINENENDILQIINNTITKNNATDAGGGLCFSQTDTTIILNTILWNNEAPEGSEIYNYEGTLEVHHCNIKGGWPDGWNNIDLEPALENDYIHLSPCGSNCINAGTDAMSIYGEYYYCPDFDFEGDPRPFETSYPDIGADESDCLVIVSTLELGHHYNKLSLYPNPTTGPIIINYTLSSSTKVELWVTDMSSKKVKILASKTQKAGDHELIFEASTLPSGIYFCTIKTNDLVQSSKMVVINDH